MLVRVQLEAFRTEPEEDDTALDEENEPLENKGVSRPKVDPCSGSRQYHLSQYVLALQDESLESKKARKQALKDERRQRRETKKGNKDAFKAEEARQKRETPRRKLKTVSLISK